MPAAGKPPTLREFLGAYGDAIRGVRSSTADTRSGAAYDLVGGTSAIVWSRQAQRDQRLFRQAYTDTAEGEDLDRHVEQKYHVERIQASYGAGKLTLTRPAVGTEAGTIYAGSRVEYTGGATPVPYVVSDDTVVPAAVTWISIPVRPTRKGPGTAISTANQYALRLTDTIFDSTLVPVGLVCGNGTDEEAPADYIARAKKTRTDRRNGYPTRIIEALQQAGADEVVLLDAHSLGAANDFGLSFAYVADSGYSTTASLILSAMQALDTVSVAGTDVQVLGMTPTPVTMSITASLIDDPGAFDQTDITQGIVAAVVEEFARRNRWWHFRADALAGVARKTSNVIQSVTVTTTPSAPAVAFPTVLPRYTLTSTAIAVTLTGPV